ADHGAGVRRREGPRFVPGRVSEGSMKGPFALRPSPKRRIHAQHRATRSPADSHGCLGDRLASDPLASVCLHSRWPLQTPALPAVLGLCTVLCTVSVPKVLPRRRLTAWPEQTPALPWSRPGRIFGLPVGKSLRIILRDVEPIAALPHGHEQLAGRM